jgi:hypothetical protein
VYRLVEPNKQFEDVVTTDSYPSKDIESVLDRVEHKERYKK